MIKIKIIFILIVLVFSIGISLSVSAQGYGTLAPIQAGDNTFVGTNVTVSEDLGEYLNGMFRLGIALAVALAVVMIIIGGIQYMSSDVVGKKEDGQSRINAALLGLVVALGSYMILYTVNPDILNTRLKLEDLTVGGVGIGDFGGITFGAESGDENPNHTRDNVVGSYRNPNNTHTIEYRNGDRTTIQPDGEQETRNPQGEVVPPTPPSPPATIPPNPPGGPMTPSPGVTPDQNSPHILPQDFPESMRDCAQQAINNSQLPNLTPADAAKYFPNGQVTAEGWRMVMGGIGRRESDFRATLPHVVPGVIDQSTGQNALAMGILQISQGSARLYGFRGITTEQLKDPCKNIEVGVKIMERWIKQDGVISGKNSAGKWRGGARYWEVLRSGTPR